MKKKNMTSMMTELKQAGFEMQSRITQSRITWLKQGEISFELQSWPCGSCGEDLFFKMEAWTSQNEIEWLLSKKDFYLSDKTMSEMKPGWAEGLIQELAKKAFDVLTAKAKTAAEIAVMAG